MTNETEEFDKRRQRVMAAIAKTVDEDYQMDFAFASINPLLEGGYDCVNRIRQILAFLAEIHLQCPAERYRAATDSDSLQGLGWILNMCQHTLAINEEIG